MTITNKLLAFVMTLALSAPALAAATTTTPVAPTTDKVVLTNDNTIVINTYYEGDVVANLVQKAKVLDSKLPTQEPLYLVINSGGGSIDAGLELIENLNNLHRPVHTLSLFAASMGFQTVQGLNGKRLLTSNGTLMSHKARGGFGGEFPGQLDSRYSYYLRRVTRMDEKAASRTAGKHTLVSYRNLIENEYWCDGADCLEQGFADKIVEPKCDNSLNGTHNQLWARMLYMGHTIEIVDLISDCPLQTEALSYNVLIDGQPLFNDVNKPATPVIPNVYNPYSYGSGSTTPLTSLTVETSENIKKIVTDKIENRKTGRQDVRKY